MSQALIRLLILLPLLNLCNTLSYNTKQVYGSTCLHDLETGSPIHFDRGEVAELVKASRAVYITSRGVHFITLQQTIRMMERDEKEISGWHKVPCVKASVNFRGSLCVIPSSLLPPSVPPLQQSFSEVLPCVSGRPDESSFIPRMSLEGYVLPMEYRLFLDGATTNTAYNDQATYMRQLTESTGSCRNAGDTVGVRQILGVDSSDSSSSDSSSSTSISSAYDLTQCDFSASGIAALYMNDTLYMTKGSTIPGPMYTVLGIMVIIIISCVTQDIVYMVNPKGSRPSRGDICMFCTIVVLICVLSTTVNNSNFDTTVFITREEVVMFWYMIVYCIIRIMIMVWKVGSHVFWYEQPGSARRLPNNLFSNDVLVKQLESIVSDHFYNLLVILLQLISSRVYMCMNTPYTMGIAFLLGSRLFLKIYNGGDVQKSAAEQLILVVDSVLLQIVYVAGVMPNYTSSAEGYIVCVVIMFVSISAARMASQASHT